MTTDTINHKISKPNDLLVPQKHLGKNGIILLITLLSMVAPLSTDMYLPALPSMTEFFQASSSLVNLTLSGFFFFMAVGILFLGAASDKYGRKPILLISLLLYGIFTGACAFAGNIYALILFRLLEAFGAGGMIAISTAIVKDAFPDQSRDTVLAVVQTMGVLAPMLAPIFGAVILSFVSWRGTFLFLVAISIICFIIALLMEETIQKEQRLNCSIFGTLGNLIQVSKHSGFTLFLICTGLLSAPYMAYISICSYIYIDYFHLSKTTYSLFFAVNSFAMVFGPIIYLRLPKNSAKKIMAVLYLLIFLTTIFLGIFAHISPVFFFLSFLPFSLTTSCLRPFSTAILLRQHDKDAGAASSVLNFIVTICGSFGMIVGSLAWSDYIYGLTITTLLFTILSLFFWIFILKSKVTLISVKD